MIPDIRATTISALVLSFLLPAAFGFVIPAPVHTRRVLPRSGGTTLSTQSDPPPVRWNFPGNFDRIVGCFWLVKAELLNNFYGQGRTTSFTEPQTMVVLRLLDDPTRTAVFGIVVHDSEPREGTQWKGKDYGIEVWDHDRQGYVWAYIKLWEHPLNRRLMFMPVPKLPKDPKEADNTVNYVRDGFTLPEPRARELGTKLLNVKRSRLIRQCAAEWREQIVARPIEQGLVPQGPAAW